MNLILLETDLFLLRIDNLLKYSFHSLFHSFVSSSFRSLIVNCFSTVLPTVFNKVHTHSTLSSYRLFILLNKLLKKERSIFWSIIWHR